MGDTYHFSEVQIKSGTIASDLYLKDVTVDFSKEFLEIHGDDGKVYKRVEKSRAAEMSIAQVFASKCPHTDGQPMKIYLQNTGGTQIWQLGSAYVQSEGFRFPEDDSVTYNVKLVGADWGTTS